MIVLIPTHPSRTEYAFKHIYRRLKDWLKDAPYVAFLIVEDNGKDKPEFQFAAPEGLCVVHNYEQDQLRGAIDCATNPKTGDFDREHHTVLIVEHDVVITPSTLKLIDWMRRAYASLSGNDNGEIASLSGLYHNSEGKLSYPAQQRWLGPVGGHSDYMGKVRDIHLAGEMAQASAVPFCCSLWRREALAQVSPLDPTLYQLDKTLGDRLTEKGWRHLRSLDHAATHIRKVTLRDAEVLAYTGPSASRA